MNNVDSASVATTTRPFRQGVEANARLTASTGAVLLVLLAAEGLTLLSLGSLLHWHELIGIMLIPPVLLKFGTTGYRFVRYYTGDEAYVRKGPPHWVLRLTAPGMVVLTIVVFASGLLLAFDRQHPQWMGIAHKASFILWFGAMTIHVLGHIRETATTGTADWLPRRSRVEGQVIRRGAVLASLAIGIASAGFLVARIAP